MILQLGSLGVSNIVRFDYLEGPSPESLSRALDSLLKIKAINLQDGKVTEKGKLLS